jgi:hypothetical protein
VTLQRLRGLATIFHPRKPDFISRILSVGYVIETVGLDGLAFPVIISNLVNCCPLIFQMLFSTIWAMGSGSIREPRITKTQSQATTGGKKKITKRSRILFTYFPLNSRKFKTVGTTTKSISNR